MGMRRTVTLAAGIALAVLGLVGRARRPVPLTGVEPTPSLGVPMASREIPRSERAPTSATAEEVRAALARAFGACVEPPSEDTSIALGDFNGDGWQDLAIVVRPSMAHSHDLNDPFRNWSVEDLGSEERRVGSAKIGRDERLLAVIHGEGRPGWRSAEAMQAHLLKIGAGTRLRVVHLESVDREITGRSSLRGDGLSQEVGGVVRVVYWTGARYALLH
jgi:FG-GAP repeat